MKFPAWCLGHNKQSVFTPFPPLTETSGWGWPLNAPSSFSDNDTLASKVSKHCIHIHYPPVGVPSLSDHRSLTLERSHCCWDFSLHGEHESPRLQQEAGNSEAGPLASCYCPQETPYPSTRQRGLSKSAITWGEERREGTHVY